jgi:Protein of unknown function (DUF3592)
MAKQEPDNFGALMYLVGIFMCLAITIAIPFMALDTSRDITRSQTWPSTEGEVVASYYDKSGDTEGSARIEYKYRVKSGDYRCGRKSFGVSSFEERDLADYPVGKKVTVYYDPDSPSNAVLSLDSSIVGVVIVASLFFFLSSGSAWILIKKSGPTLSNRASWRLEETGGFFSLMPAAFVAGLACALWGENGHYWIFVFVFLIAPLILLLTPPLRRKFGPASGCGVPFAALLGLAALNWFFTYPVVITDDSSLRVSCHGVIPGMSVIEAKAAAFDLTSPLAEGQLYGLNDGVCAIVAEGKILAVTGGDVAKAEALLGRSEQVPIGELGGDIKPLPVAWAPVSGGLLLALCREGKVETIRGPRYHRGRSVVLEIDKRINPHSWQMLMRERWVPQQFDGRRGVQGGCVFTLKIERLVLVHADLTPSIHQKAALPKYQFAKVYSDPGDVLKDEPLNPPDH